MEIGIDSFAAANLNSTEDKTTSNVTSMNYLLERIEHADKAGLHVFGIGEHHRKEFLDSAPTMILAAAAARTKNIRLTSAVTVISAADPVRVFQNFATLDLISNGRAEIVAGRGSFIEAYPLFGYKLEDYDKLFAEKLDLLLKIRDNEMVTWSGKYRAPAARSGHLSKAGSAIHTCLAGCWRYATIICKSRYAGPSTNGSRYWRRDTPFQAIG
jgi:alkanesulfonate monooxygenase SsuD/methylene tetrahydromethanopterin reductase-like flavin-dependent oxidoreductase (luciferase family)